jgi:chromosome segregation ATPase
MDFKEIDSMFEGAIRRLNVKGGPADPYGEPPLASDHFLLKRSWEYFQRRASAMEAEWKQLLSAKEAEVKALEEIVRLRDQRLAGLEGATKDTEKIEEEFARAQLAEQRGFSDASRKLHETWEEEREALIRSVEEATARVQRIRAEAEHRVKAGQAEVAALRVSLEKARAEIQGQAEKRLASESEAAKAMNARDEMIRSLESKVELLKSELERRDSTIKDLTGRSGEEKRGTADLTSKLASVTGELAAKAERAGFLEEKLEAARRENEDLRAAWKREQAEWRELWDRSREMWERERRSGDLPSGEAGK